MFKRVHLANGLKPAVASSFLNLNPYGIKKKFCHVFFILFLFIVQWSFVCIPSHAKECSVGGESFFFTTKRQFYHNASIVRNASLAWFLTNPPIKHVPSGGWHLPIRQHDEAMRAFMQSRDFISNENTQIHSYGILLPGSRRITPQQSIGESFVHKDLMAYNCVVYLTPTPTPTQVGSTMWSYVGPLPILDLERLWEQHDDLGLDSSTETKKIIKKESFSNTSWREICHVPWEYNKLVCFDAEQWRSAGNFEQGGGFGDSFTTMRLIHYYNILKFQLSRPVVFVSGEDLYLNSSSSANDAYEFAVDFVRMIPQLPELKVIDRATQKVDAALDIGFYYLPTNESNETNSSEGSLRAACSGGFLLCIQLVFNQSSRLAARPMWGRATANFRRVFVIKNSVEAAVRVAAMLH